MPTFRVELTEPDRQRVDRLIDLVEVVLESLKNDELVVSLRERQK